MKLLVDLFEFAVVDLRVDLSSLDVRMPEHLLNETQVGSAG